MKITRNRLILYTIVIIILTLLVNTSKVEASFADFTDEEADKQAQEQIKQQEKEHNITEVKSSDNYLINLQIDGYKLTPEFDKQTLEYTIDGDIKTNEININATPSNEKATINGAGIVKIEENKNEYRIDVTAENGSVRTYIIKLKETEKTDQGKNNGVEQIEQNVEQNNSKMENENTDKNLSNEKNSSNVVLYTIIAVLFIIILVLVIVIMRKRKKSKH